MGYTLWRNRTPRAAKEPEMIYRMCTSIVIWVTASVMVVLGKLRDRDLAYVLAAATVSTIAAWALQPAAAPTRQMPE
jgi:hypothetical protein